MTYAQNGLIQASDYNTFRTSVANVYGVGFGNSGYGQTVVPLSAVSGGNIQLVRSLEWTRLRSAIDVCAQHQGSTVSLPSTALIGVGSAVRAHPPAAGNFSTSISTISTNRFNFTGTRSTIVQNVVGTSRTALWSVAVFCELQFQFARADQARYFFNSGGQILFRSSRTGGSATTQNNVLSTFLSGLASIYMNHNSSASTSGTGTGTAIGYYQLTNVYQTIYSKVVGTAPIATHNVTVRARRAETTFGANGDNGRTIIFRYEFNGVSGAPNKDGTLQVLGDWRIATGILSITQPAVSTITALSAS